MEIIVKREVMSRMIFFVVIILACMSQACEKDPTFEFKGDDRIYFVFPKYMYGLGVEGHELDSVVFSMVGEPASVLQDTCWMNVKRVGERTEIDKRYVVTVVKDISTAVEGIDFETLKPEYVFRKNVGIDSFPVIVNREHLKTVLSKKIMFALQETEDFKLGFVEYSRIKLVVTDFLQEPEWWYTVSGWLGAYHYMKYEKWIELTGSMDKSSSQSYRQYYCLQIKDYFNNNIIIDPITNERVTCDL